MNELTQTQLQEWEEQMTDAGERPGEHLNSNRFGLNPTSKQTTCHIGK